MRHWYAERRYVIEIGLAIAIGWGLGAVSALAVVAFVMLTS
jgi:hypothetical protein